MGDDWATTSSTANSNKPLGLQNTKGFAQGGPGYPHLKREFVLRRQEVASLEGPVDDLFPNTVSDHFMGFLSPFGVRHGFEYTVWLWIVSCR